MFPLAEEHVVHIPLLVLKGVLSQLDIRSFLQGA